MLVSTAIGFFDAFFDYVTNNQNVEYTVYKNDCFVVKFKNENEWRLTCWCPKGRLWEDNGKIPDEYPLQETKTNDYKERTKLNIKDAEATLIVIVSIFNSDNNETGLTIEEANNLNKLLKIINLDEEANNISEEVFKWIKEKNIKHLNMAGPRASTCEGIYDKTFIFMNSLLKKLEDYQD
ncbi:13365_t:CDS:2 [Cetraspora pellucida]|uniref:13365_t:CDS:1 n=1 Tax=Cetraspora pellucida TaxID=1433469 RepID=A0A9N9FXR9_9GLOM|nr:13365_t:CDS:2 [Cetraspora pellucida]